MKIKIHTQKSGAPLGDLYGIFFEDLNHAADGGLYAEMVQNRSFEFAPIDHPDLHALTAWEKIEVDGEVKLVVETGNPVSSKNPHYLGIDVLVPGKNVGVQNIGFNTGLSLVAGETYYFSCYAKREQCFDQGMKVSLRSKAGEVYVEQILRISETWTKYELELVVPETDTSGRLALTFDGRGKIYLDFVSLFPKNTFKGRRNGLRKDIAEKLAALHPKFMRFPGGCLVHDGALDPDARDAMYRWKNTIGPLEDRPARRSNWGYNQTLGLGFCEYFLFCEDIGAKPLPVVPGGWDPHHKRTVDLDKMQPWIQDALDLIEFANGDVTTIWGKKRANMGHPLPFGLEYIGIGNEEVGEAFFERYELFHEAIREQYPEIKIINSSGPFASGGEYERGWNSAKRHQSDFVDEHYYCSPEWFLANHHRYDHFSKSDPKVFLGEYASWGNTYYNALVEASYMIGLERNAQVVGLACYAPLLCNTGYVNWKPDLIWFDNHQVMVTPNYYVQQLFMHHQGTHQLEMLCEGFPENSVVSETPDQITGNIVLKSNETTVHYEDIQVVNEETQEIQSFPNVVLTKGMEALLTYVDWKNYTIKLKAKEVEGFKGFNLVFGQKDSENFLSWEIGGWQNQDATLTEYINGRGACLTQNLITVERHRTYDLELQVRGRHLQTIIDGKIDQAIECKPVVIEPLYAIASKDAVTGDVLLKVVNVSEINQQVQIGLVDDTKISVEKTEKTEKVEKVENVKQLENAKQIEKLEQTEEKQADVYALSGYALEAVNSFEKMDYIQPKHEIIEIRNGLIEYEFLKHSVTVIRIHENKTQENL